MVSKAGQFRTMTLLIVTIALILSGRASSQPHRKAANAGPDGVGGIPYAGGPQSPNGVTVPYLLTLGLVVDNAQVAMPNVAVIVMAFDGTIVAAGVTDNRGLFVVALPVVAGLTISLPMNGVNELPIEAGVPVLIVVP